MPYLDKEDFIYQNIGHTDSSKVLFTDGTLKIKLDKIFNALKDHGYSVNIKNDNGNRSTWPLYSYNVSASGDINLYVQLQNIFDTKDLNLTPNDTWDSNDSLISAKVEFYNPVTMRQTGLEDLKANGNYTYDLYDPSGKQIAKDVPVGQNIGKLSVGRYRVVYHYEINGNKMVSKEAYINVSKPVHPTTPPKQPINPPAPVTPEQPTVSENPTSPVQLSSPSNSNVTPLPEVTPTRPVAPSTPDVNTDNDSDTVRPHAEKVSANSNKKTVTPKNINVTNNKVAKATPVSNVHSQTNSKNVTRNTKNTLPQTGEKKEASVAIVGLLAAALGIFGLAITKHRIKK